MARTFVRQVISATVNYPDGSVDHRRSRAVWTLAHRGYSGRGRLDIWAYPSKIAASRAGAELAMECGLDTDPEAVALFDKGRFDKVMARYEETSPDSHLLRVQPAFLQEDDAEAT